MANWTVFLDPTAPDGGANPRVEAPNAVAYVTYTSDDNRSAPNVRVSYALEIDLLDFLARECERLSALDERNAQMSDVVANSVLVAGPIALPDVSKQQALQAAIVARNLLVSKVLTDKQIADAVALDPTIADAVNAAAAAQAAADQAAVATPAKG